MGREVMPTLEVKQLVVSSGGTLITSGVTKTRTSQVYIYPASNGKAGATATVGYVNTGTNTQMITLAQNATADTWVIPLDLKQGDIITAIGICGQIDSAGNTATVDYALRAQTAVATGCTDAVIQAGTQVSKTADYLVNETTAVAVPHTIVTGVHPYMLITCTTGAVTDVELLYVSVTVTEK